MNDGVLTLHTAFSRESSQKFYVSHRLNEDIDNLWELIGTRVTLIIIIKIVSNF